MMKKILAVMMTLCMMLGMTTVVAEATVSGTWYLVMTGLTVATFELNEDGTCAVMPEMNGTETKLEGTWTQDQDRVSIVVNDQTLPLVLDGENMTFNMEDLAAMGLAQSGLPGAGTDPSILNGLIRISREPGLVTSAEFSAYQADGTLPEGKTKEDMDAAQAQIMSSLMLLMGGAGAQGEQGMAQEQPGPELTVVEDNFFIREGYDETEEGVYLAKVQNDHDAAVTLTEGTLTLLDAEGQEIARSDYFGTTGSLYLEPGEATYVSLMAEVADGSLVKSHTVRLNTILGSGYQPKDTRLEVSAPELKANRIGDYTEWRVSTTFTNTTDQPMTGINAAVAVRDSEGKLIDVVLLGLHGNELAAGSTIILVDGLDSRVANYCAGNGTTPDQTEALAWISE